MVKVEDNGATSTMTWINQLNYINNGTLTSVRDASLYHLNTDEVYLVGLLNTNILFFTAVSQSTGTLTRKIYTIDESTSAITFSEIVLTSNKMIYILVLASIKPIIHTFDPVSDSIKTSYASVSSFNAYSIAIVKDMLIITGTTTSNNCSVFK